MAQVYEREIDGKLLSLLVVLADHADDAGVCWPSQPYLAWKLSCSERTVKRSIAALIEAGAIERHHERGRQNVYRIRLDQLPRKAAYVPPAKPFADAYGDEPDGQNGSEGGQIGPTPTQNVTGDNPGQSRDIPGQGRDKPGREWGHSCVPLTTIEPSENHQEPPGGAATAVPAEPVTEDQVMPTGGQPAPSRKRMSPVGTDEGFDEFLDAYPARIDERGVATKGSPSLARKEWRKLTGPKRRAAMAGLAGYTVAAGRMPVDAKNYLRQELWLDHVPARGQAAPAPAGEDRSPDDPALARVLAIDVEIARIRANRDDRYYGSTGMRQQADDIAALERERRQLLEDADGDDRGAA